MYTVIIYCLVLLCVISTAMSMYQQMNDALVRAGVEMNVQVC